MTKAAKGVDSILHLAALNGTENFYKRPELVLDVGILGLYATLNAARANDVAEFVLASSSEAYQTPPVVPTPEDVPLTIPDPWNPRYSYGGSKLISEIIVANYLRDVFKKLIVFRPHNVYGPDMGNEHVIPQLAARAAKQIALHPEGDVPFQIQGDGSQTRSFVYIDDFIDGLLLLIDRGSHRETYHIGTEDEVSIAHLVEVIFKQLGRGVSLIPSELPAGGTLRRCPDTTKLRSLGYAPKVSLEEGVQRTVSWYLEAA
jgi:nucleoside-diphosphate-sugar epimerase